MSLMDVINNDSVLVLDDFGVNAVYKGKTISVTFNAPTEVVNLTTGQIEISKPEAVCATSDVSDIIHGSMIIINGTTYYAYSVKADGYGLTTVELSEDQ